jgi:mannosyltransferase
VSAAQQPTFSPDSCQLSVKAADSRVQFALWFSSLIAVAAVLRMIELGRSLWLDEAASSMLARTDWHTFVIALLRRQSNMSLYYLLLRGWIHFGNTEAWLRFPSVIFGVAAVPLIYRLARDLFGPRTGRIAAFLMSIHVFHIQYSQQARGYTLLVFLVILSCHFFVRLLSSAEQSTRAAYILASVLMLYAHVFGVWILLAQWLSALALSNSANTRRAVSTAAVAIAILSSPLVISLLFVSDRSQLSWITHNSAVSLYRFFLDLSGNARSPLLVVYLFVLLVSLRSFLHRPEQPANAKIAYVLLWASILLPTLIVGGISLRWPILQGRYLIICLPAFLILAADGVVHIRSKPIFVAALLTIAGLSLLGLNSYYKERADPNHNDNWRDATTYCLSHSQPGDVVLFTYSAEEIPFRDYQDRFTGRRPEITLVPEETELALLTTAGTWASPALVSSVASRNRRVWVITALQPNAASSEAQAVLGNRLNEESRRIFGFVSLKLFAPVDHESH